MDQLITCRCGHSIAAHATTGCEGRQIASCPCKLSAAEVLERAVAAARTSYGQWSDAV